MHSLLNIVIFYIRLANGSIVPLSKHHVDTGMGFERLVTFLQGKKSNYDTDLFRPLFDAIQKHSNAPNYKGTFNNDDTGKLDYGYRILADHTRMVTVALADNMLPEQQYVMFQYLEFFLYIFIFYIFYVLSHTLYVNTIDILCLPAKNYGEYYEMR